MTTQEPPSPSSHGYGAWLADQFQHVPLPAPAEAVKCWHTEAGTPCDWDRCEQPERLARGDRGTDPADA